MVTHTASAPGEPSRPARPGRVFSPSAPHATVASRHSLVGAVIAFALLAVIFWTPTAWAADNASPFAGGSGTADDPFTIATVDQLTAFRDSVNKGTDYEGQHIQLTADLSLSDPWTPIGAATRKSSGLVNGSTPFRGTFNGGGHRISGLTIAETQGTDYALGLFGALDGATVENLVLDDVSIDVPKSELAGGLAGLAVGNATVREISVSGKVAGAAGIGGVVGRMTLSGTIDGCTNTASVSATGIGNAGGIVGAAYYTTLSGAMNITGCANSGTVNGSQGIGGIAGLSSAFVGTCTNSGAVTGENYSVGGIVGEQKNYGKISHCTNSGAIANTSAKGYGTGGIVGWVRYDGAISAYPASADVTVMNNTNRGAVQGGNDAGGIVGTFYNGGSVTGNTNEAPSLKATTFGGGIVGNLQNAPASTVPSTVKEGITVQNNVSTTSASSIDAPLKDAFAYNNDPASFSVAYNGTAWVATANHTAFASLGHALDVAADGSTVTLTADEDNQAPVKLTNEKTVTLNLGGHRLLFTSGPGVTIQKGALIIAGQGTMGLASDPKDGTLFDVAPSQGQKASVELQGGTYDENVEPYVADSYAVLVLHDAQDAMDYEVIPLQDAKAKAQAAVTYQGHTEYFENAEDAKAAAATEPGAQVTLLNTGTTPSTPGAGTTPGTSGTGTTSGAGTTPGASGTEPGGSSGSPSGGDAGHTPGNPSDSGATSRPAGTNPLAHRDDSSADSTNRKPLIIAGSDSRQPGASAISHSSAAPSSTATRGSAVASHGVTPQTGDPLSAVALGSIVLAGAATGALFLSRTRIKRHRS